MLPVPGLGMGAPVVWGVLNVTPDSFSDGGRFNEGQRAVEHARHLNSQGADVIDVGGESTRPGAQRVSVDEECARVLPVIEALAAEGMIVSIDTMRSEVARAAVSSGASIVNDVSGGRADPHMHSAVADLSVPYVLMHWRGHAGNMDELAVYDDPVAQVIDELREQVRHAVASGIAPEALILDPGLGFAKGPEHNWQVLRGISDLDALGFPLLVGASRKRFLGSLLADPDGAMRATDGRDVATATLNGFLAERGVWGIRVHDVQGSVDAIKVAMAMQSRGM